MAKTVNELPESDQRQTQMGAADGDTTPPEADIQACLVTGGAGFLGSHLVRALLERGHRVQVLDLMPPDFEHERLRFFRGDLRCYEDILKAMTGVDTVFHTASIVNLLSFCSAALRQESYDINVGGTENVIRACRESGVTRLVYTSSNNVIFDGRDIELADESLPYPEKYVDLYSETKSLAERKVLAANGTQGLLTCAIRPSGIYGPGEKLFLPRIIARCDDGLLRVRVGKERAKSEYSYVDNLVHGHLLAAHKLVPESPAPGQAYFINDGEYLDNFEFFRPIIEDLGFAFPERLIPAFPLKAVTALGEIAHWLLKTPRPVLTVIEVLKASVSHPCSIEKARRDLGYEPVVSGAEAVERCLPYCRETLREREKVDRPHPAWWASIIIGMVALGLLAHHPPTWAFWSQHVIGAIPHWVYQAGLWVAVLTHLHKGLKAVRLAERAGLHHTSNAWGWQTLILGFASMNLLLPRIERATRERGQAG
jgi:3beta-hydroxy-delta5-steroid dehydrogenase/steroid delta-isomerase